jgi:hypothetical protein
MSVKYFQVRFSGLLRHITAQPNNPKNQRILFSPQISSKVYSSKYLPQLKQLVTYFFHTNQGHFSFHWLMPTQCAYHAVDQWYSTGGTRTPGGTNDQSYRITFLSRANLYCFLFLAFPTLLKNESCTNNFGGTKLSGEMSLGVRAEKRLNTTAIKDLIKIRTWRFPHSFG